MPDNAEYRDVPFQEAIDFFKQKVNVPSQVWADILGGAHARAFTVAGATKEGMLTDFRAAIDDAISNGTTIADFRKSFDDIVTKYGWDYKGGRGWRTRVIYNTNLSTAYSAGRYRQMTDPDVLAYQPYWVYRHADGVKHPRKEHLAWNGLTLKADDPWWKSHYPPNGWGCHCYAEPVTRRELQASGKQGPDQAPPLEMREVTLNTSAGPHKIAVPKGIDPGWGYNVGDAAYGTRPPSDVLAAATANQDKWTRLTQGDWRSEGRLERLPVDQPKAERGPTMTDRTLIAAAIERAIGGKEMALALPNGASVFIDAKALADHIDPRRAAFIPFLAELIADPAEIWLTFQQHNVTGQVAMRTRVLKLIDLGHDQGLVLVLDAGGGMLQGVTFIPTERPAYVQNQRVGKLVWGRGASGEAVTGASGDGH
jgi:hypothetical protein